MRITLVSLLSLKAHAATVQAAIQISCYSYGTPKPVHSSHGHGTTSYQEASKEHSILVSPPTAASWLSLTEPISVSLISFCQNRLQTRRSKFPRRLPNLSRCIESPRPILYIPFRHSLSHLTQLERPWCLSMTSIRQSMQPSYDSLGLRQKILNISYV